MPLNFDVAFDWSNWWKWAWKIFSSRNQRSKFESTRSALLLNGKPIFSTRLKNSFAAVSSGESTGCLRSRSNELLVLIKGNANGWWLSSPLKFIEVRSAHRLGISQRKNVEIVNWVYWELNSKPRRAMSYRRGVTGVHAWTTIFNKFLFLSQMNLWSCFSLPALTSSIEKRIENSFFRPEIYIIFSLNEATAFRWHDFKLFFFHKNEWTKPHVRCALCNKVEEKSHKEVIEYAIQYPNRPLLFMQYGRSFVQMEIQNVKTENSFLHNFVVAAASLYGSLWHNFVVLCENVLSTMKLFFGFRSTIFRMKERIRNALANEWNSKFTTVPTGIRTATTCGFFSSFLSLTVKWIHYRLRIRCAHHFRPMLLIRIDLSAPQCDSRWKQQKIVN